MFQHRFLPTLPVDEIISYNQIIDYINKVEEEKFEKKNESEELFKFNRITGHQGPLNTSDKHYKGSKYNVLMEC